MQIFVALFTVTLYSFLLASLESGNFSFQLSKSTWVFQTSFSCSCGRGSGLPRDFALIYLFCSWHSMGPHGWKDKAKVSGWFSSLHWTLFTSTTQSCVTIINENSVQANWVFSPSPKCDVGISAPAPVEALLGPVHNSDDLACYLIGNVKLRAISNMI